ncbi:MAG: YkgJ family cysteine cluster protein [Fusobacteriaceae bacterium]
MFFCDKCGICCKNLQANSIYINLHNGNGVCKYLDLKTNLCKIYEKRPLLCNLKESYEKYFSNVYSEEYFFELNLDACKKLKKNK